jgi:NAD-binding of NADP-dependent 3-hydroxyisobutyrate dehydrogenase
VEPSAFNGLTDKRLLIGGKMYFHTILRVGGRTAGVNGVIAAMGEALVLPTRAGLDPETVFNALKGGLAGSAVLNAKAPMDVNRNFKPGFHIRLHQKDLRNALNAAESMKVGLPPTSAAPQTLLAFRRKSPLSGTIFIPMRGPQAHA